MFERQVADVTSVPRNNLGGILKEIKLGTGTFVRPTPQLAELKKDI